MSGEESVNIYVIDDDEAVRDSLSALLTASEWPVATFASAREFLEKFDPSQMGCVIADVRMPGMDGLQLQEVLASRCPRMPVIVITGHGDIPMAVRAMKAGAADFIEKPFDADALIDRIALAVESSRESSRAMPVPPEEVSARLGRLTTREVDVMRHLVAGEPNKVIAYELGISPRTVEIHRARVLEKMDTPNVSQLIRMILAAGLDPL